MPFTDLTILASFDRFSLTIAGDPFQHVCHDVLGYRPLRGVTMDMTEFNAFEARYKVLITPEMKMWADIERTCQAARLAVEYEEQLANADPSRSPAQVKRLKDIFNVLSNLPKQIGVVAESLVR